MSDVMNRYNELKAKLDFATTDADSQGKIIVQVGSATCENTTEADLVRKEFLKLINARKIRYCCKTNRMYR